MRIGGNEARLAQNIEFRGFYQEMAFAACTALIALVFRHDVNETSRLLKVNVPIQSLLVNLKRLCSFLH